MCKVIWHSTRIIYGKELSLWHLMFAWRRYPQLLLRTIRPVRGTHKLAQRTVLRLIRIRPVITHAPIFRHVAQLQPTPSCDRRKGSNKILMDTINLSSSPGMKPLSVLFYNSTSNAAVWILTSANHIPPICNLIRSFILLSGKGWQINYWLTCICPQSCSRLAWLQLPSRDGVTYLYLQHCLLGTSPGWRWRGPGIYECWQWKICVNPICRVIYHKY